MKSISILPLLAIIISPVFSQPHNAVNGNTPNSAPIDSRSGSVPQACHDTNAIVYRQLEEISRLQARSLPTTHDGAGYLYAISSGRKMLGCPTEVLLNSNGSDTSASRQFKRSSGTTNPLGHDPGYGDPCEVVRLLNDQVEDQMGLMTGYKIATPDYLAGWYSGTQDLDDGLKCGYVHPKGTGQPNAKVSDEE